MREDISSLSTVLIKAKTAPDRFSNPSDRLLLRQLIWLLSSGLSRLGNIIWLCVTEPIAARESGGRIHAAIPSDDGASAAVSCLVTRCWRR